MRRPILALLPLSFVAACHEDPGLCQPGDATFSALTGSVSIAGTPTIAFDKANAPGTAECTVSSRPSGDRNADVLMRTTIDLSCDRGGEHLSISFDVDDVRVLDAGAHALDTGEYGLRIAYRPNEAAPECYTYLQDTRYELTVREAIGEMAPYPALVTGDFHRKIDVVLDLALNDRAARKYVNGVVSDCALDFDGTIAFAANLEAADYQSRGTDTCILE